MKKISCLALFLSVASYTASAQLYISAGLGYAVPQAGQTMYDTPIPYNGFPTGFSGSRNNSSSGSSYTYNIKSASFSSGVQSAIGMGYMFSENIGVQLDASIGLSSTKYTFNDNNVNLNTAASPVAGYINTTQQAKTPVLLMPALVLQTGGNKTNLYTRFGIALPLNTKITQDQVMANAPGTGAIYVDDFTWQIKSSFSLGFTAAAGVRYKINDRFSIWGELSLLSMSLNIKEQDLQSLTQNGQSIPLSSYTYPTTIKFSKTATVDSNLASFPTYSQPFSNIGLKVGVTFNLTEQKHTHHSRRSNDEDIDNTKPFRRR